MIISLRALRQVEILAVDTAAEFPPDYLLFCIYCLEFTLHLLYGVLVLKESDSEFFACVGLWEEPIQ